MAQTISSSDSLSSSVSHMGVVMLGMATLTEVGLNGSVFQMLPGIISGLFFALVGLVYEKSTRARSSKMSGFGRMMPGIATSSPSPLFLAGAARDRGVRGRAADVPGRLAIPRTPGGSSPGCSRLSHVGLRAAGDQQIFWGPPSPIRTS